MNTPPMKVNWLLEDYDPEQNILPRLIEAIENQGHQYKTIKYQSLQSGDCYNIFSDSECVVFWGSLNLAKQIRHTEWIPGVYCGLPQYDCSNYYPYFQKQRFNKHYYLVPYGDLLELKSVLFNSFGEDDYIFMRPNRGDKQFSGTLVKCESYDEDIERFNFGEALTPKSLILITSPKNIFAEYRFIVVDHKVITGSLYHYRDKHIISSNYPLEALALAKEVAEVKYVQDRAYCIDICETSFHRFHLLELGCFSCCGLYACNLNEIVKHISLAALNEWTDLYETRQ